MRNSLKSKLIIEDLYKAAAYDHDAFALRTRRLHDRRCLIRLSVGQHRAHGSPLVVLIVIHGFSSSVSGTAPSPRQPKYALLFECQKSAEAKYNRCHSTAGTKFNLHFMLPRALASRLSG